MTKEEKHRLSCYIRTLVERTDSPDAKHALDAVLEFIQNDDEFPEPEGLDEAARKYSYGRYATWVASDAFKAGAEWAFGQGVMGDGEIVKDINNTLAVTAKIKGLDSVFTFGEKVIVQIRKP